MPENGRLLAWPLLWQTALYKGETTDLQAMFCLTIAVDVQRYSIAGLYDINTAIDRELYVYKSRGSLTWLTLLTLAS